MGAGYVGIISAELHFPESGSLKTKRKDLKSVKAQLVQRFQVAVAEVDHHETWQRSQITAACRTKSAPNNRLLAGMTSSSGLAVM